MTKKNIVCDSIQIQIQKKTSSESMFVIDNLSLDNYHVELTDILYERGLIFISMDSLESAFPNMDYCIQN